MNADEKAGTISLKDRNALVFIRVHLLLSAFICVQPFNYRVAYVQPLN